MAISMVKLFVGIFAVAILLVAAAAAFWMNRRWAFASRGRFPRHRHAITRAICVALGGTIVVTLAIVTLVDAHRPYREPESMNVLVPTLPLADHPDSVAKGRFLVHLILASWSSGSMVPIHGETFEVRWPEDKDR